MVTTLSASALASAAAAAAAADGPSALLLSVSPAGGASCAFPGAASGCALNVGAKAKSCRSVLAAAGSVCLGSAARAEAPAPVGCGGADATGMISPPAGCICLGSAAWCGGERVLGGGVVRRNEKTSSAVACPS